MSAAHFTINASPGTDVWRKPPTTDIFNAPSHPPPSAPATGLLATLFSARISFLLPPVSSAAQYDQAGLLLSLTPRGRQQKNPAASASPPKWLKTGVEVYNGIPRAATVACDAFADWSLAPVSASGGDDDDEKGEDWVTVEVVNGKDELGKSLWVYQVVGGERVPLREVCWPFGHGGGEAWEVKVEAYACRPSETAGEELKALFRDFEVKWV
ncbi:unnamed protein product [Discula destructiva]